MPYLSSNRAAVRTATSLLTLVCSCLFFAVKAVGAVDVLTYRYSNSRNALNDLETNLTPANVRASGFGRLFKQPVVGQIQGQPLIVNGLSFGARGIHNVVYVTTEANHVYAFDADSADGANSQPLWHVDFNAADGSVTSVPTADLVPPTIGIASIFPEVGITATPVIDRDALTLFVEVFSKEDGAYVHRLHALDIITGAERTGSPVVISGSVPGTGVGSANGTLPFNPRRHICRASLTLATPVAYNRKVIFLAYGAMMDYYDYHGWIMAYDAVTLERVGLFCTTPNSSKGSIWMAGNALTADENGNIYGVVANGPFNAANSSYGDTVICLSTDSSGLHLKYSFTPYNATALETADWDLGTGGLTLLPSQVGTPTTPNLAVFGSKEGRIYLLNRDNLGKFNSGSDSQIPQWLWAIPGQTAYSGPNFGQPIFYNSNILFHVTANYLYSTPISSGVIGTNSTILSKRGASAAATVVSANGRTNAVAWELNSPNWGKDPAILYAYAGDSAQSELFNTAQSGTRDVLGPGVKHSLPIVANSKVYVGAVGELDVLGFGTWVANPTISPNGGTFGSTSTVTLACSTAGSSIYYTIDGSTPTTNSILYSGPFTLTQSAIVKAVGYASNKLPSGVITANFTALSSLGSGTGLLGQYWANQFITFNGSPTLVRTDAVINLNFIPPSTPSAAVGSKFNVRWTGSLQAQASGPHTIYLVGTDGKRFWFNGQLVINEWHSSVTPQYTFTTDLVAGQKYALEFDHFQNSFPTVVQLAWSSPITATVPIPQSQLYPPSGDAGPSVTITPIPGTNLVAGGALTVSAQATSSVTNVMRVDFVLDGAISASLIAPPFAATFTGLDPGPHTVSANATDGNGTMTSSQVLTITVSTNPAPVYGIATRPTFPAYLNFPKIPSGSFPTLLSSGGVFSDTPSFTLTNGWIAFTPAAPFWSDGATKSRWFGIPFAGQPLSPGNQISYSKDGNWDFPVGSVFLKHFGLVTNEVGSPISRRLETRVLVYYGGGNVAGASYRWRPDGSDADLVSDAQTEDIIIASSSGNRTQTWYYPSPADCLVCHASVAGGVLGVSKTRQQNFSTFFPQTGTNDNQLRVLNHLGLLHPALDEPSIPSLPSYAAPGVSTASLELRARSFLDVNCAYCHQPGGSGRASFDMRITTPLNQANLINGPILSTFGIAGAAPVVPGQPLSSIVYHRVATAVPGVMMPPLARSLIDSPDASVLGKWIYSLGTNSPFVVGKSLLDNNLAVATSIVPLALGSTPGPSNYTLFSQGLRGLVIDVSTLANPGSLSAADFEFQVAGFSPTTVPPDGGAVLPLRAPLATPRFSPATVPTDGSAWSTAPIPSSISVQVGAGVGGADRITVIWPSGAIQRKWLRLRVLPTANTGLAVSDLSYFGTAGPLTPSISVLPTSDLIPFGTPLGNSTLTGGVASVPGTFAFLNPAAIINVGTSRQTVRFTPNDTANYTVVDFQVSVTIDPIMDIPLLPNAFLAVLSAAFAALGILRFRRRV